MAGFFQTLIHPEREEDPEMSVVAQAANILQVGEFQLIQLAYHDWFGFDMPAAQIDRIFAAYMLHGAVPHWARHYARKVIDHTSRGALDMDHPDFHRYDAEYVTHVPRGTRRFWVACAVLALFMVGGLLVGEMSSFEPTSVLPPFFEEKDLVPGPEGG